VLCTFFLVLSYHPDVLAKAHAELDAVVGLDRLPILEDRPNLPYIEAVMTETMRFGPPLPNGFPHETSEDDVYEGYFIRKGTMVLPNIWFVSKHRKHLRG
jgi:cytochrome P450